MRKQREYEEIIKDIQEVNEMDRKRIRKHCKELRRYRPFTFKESIENLLFEIEFWADHMVFTYGYALYILPLILFLISIALMIFKATR